MLQLTGLSTLLLALSGASVGDSELIPAPEFAAPLQLTADGDVISKYMYPSPKLHDIDGDGRRELVVGDLFGRVVVADPDGQGADVQWHGLKPLQVDGEDLRLNNW